MNPATDPPARASDSDIAISAHAGSLLDLALSAGVAACAACVPTFQVADAVHDAIRHAGAEPLLAVQPGCDGRIFGHSACLSVNEEVLHSPPRARILREGDVVTVDIALRHPATPAGRCVDAAVSVAVGDASRSQRACRLIAASRAVTLAAIRACVPGTKWLDVAALAARTAADHGTHLLHGYSGHGVGAELHEPPRLDFGPQAWMGGLLSAGMIITVEPVVIEGTDRVNVLTLDDGWTVVTADRRWAAHHEATVQIAEDGPRVLAGGRWLL
ncbi:MAG: M24 family metallopeptidase [Planctomycetes bacterium]|nr:M24 family metallopeptidase [Planctomycetota bacterium]